MPTFGKSGEKVRISRTPAYRVIFNPRSRAYGIAMRDVGYHSAYRADAPSKTVLSRPKTEPIQNATFKVPNVPAGLYLVLIFDGSENGQHKTWAYYHVLGRPPESRVQMTAPPATAPQPQRSDLDSASSGLGVVGLAVALAMLASGVLMGIRWKRRRT